MSKTFDRSNYKPGFWAFIATQFQGALSDNFFQYFLAFFLIGAVFSQTGSEGPSLTTADISAYATMVFAVPFILFPGLFGAIADRFSKQRVMVSTKYLEVGVMVIGGIALYIANPYFLFFVFFLMATQSALFGPAKYGILPEILPEDRLSWGNGIVQLTTTVAAVAGIGLGGPFYQYLEGRADPYWASVVLVGLACVGLMTSRYISRPPAADAGRSLPVNPWAGMGQYIKALVSDKWLFLTVLGYVYFWFAATFVRANLLPFGVETLELSPTQISVMLVSLAFGIAAGAISAGYMSRGKVEVGLIPLGALGMTVFCALLAWDGFGYQASMPLLFGLGFFAGIFDVPLISTLQQRSPKHIRGGIMAAVNMLTWIGIFSAGALFWVLTKINVSPHGIFLIAAGLSLVAGVYITALLPVFLLRFILWILANTLYRVRVLGRENIPEQGGALLVANHTSFLDALVILASIDRPVRFIMYQGIYDIPWIKPLAKMMGAIPVRPGGGPREMVRSLRLATDSLKSGDLVCIFAEGQITRTGQMLPFRRGFERIMKGADAPVIPVYIDEIWGSIFSFSEGKFFWKWPKKIPFPITIGYGEPMPSDANAFEVRSAILELGTEAYAGRGTQHDLLHRLFIRKARRQPFSLAIADVRSGALSHAKTLAGSIILGRKLKEILGPEEITGILLPQSVGGVLTNIALQIMGKVPVNLNYTGSADSMEAAARRCGMRHVITARAFLEQFPVEVPGEAIYVEDLLESVTSRDRIVGMLMALFWPIKRLERALGSPENRSADDLATVIFSSGSEGEPKGVMLTQHNVVSNIECALRVFPYKKGDCLVGILPFFHAFGFTATLWMVLTREFKGVYHPNPMEPRAIGGLIKKYKGTILFSTSTFLQGFIRRCSATQLSTLNFVIAGAEKLAPRVRDAFREKFGVEPLEGYGTTECSPIVSLNVPDFRAPGFYQKGTKRGSIGHPLPGISVRIVDPETREPLQNGQSGILQVKGPSVMKGYLGQPEKTAEVLRDGWYETGDISTIDEEGFITITDRLARFSKIGGEMVSHTKIEEAFHKVLEEDERVLAIASVPDESKGERIVVLHTMPEHQFEELMDKLDETGLPNLWLPKQKAFYRVDEIPILGTGKMDLKAVKTLARRLDIGE